MRVELLSSEMRVIFQLMKISHFYDTDDDDEEDQSVTQSVSEPLLIVRP